VPLCDGTHALIDNSRRLLSKHLFSRLLHLRERSFGRVAGNRYCNGVPGVVRVVYDRLEADKRSIDSALGEDMLWSEQTENTNYRVQVPWVSGDALNEADWPRQHAWLADQVERIYRVFEPRIAALPDKKVLADEASRTATS
jgi:hypothetical protein